MTCENCNPSRQGYFIRYKETLKGKICAICGMPLVIETACKTDLHTPWDQYFYRICEAVSSKSPCLSRKIGAILVRDHSIVSTGFNGPSRGIPHCGRERNIKDDLLITNAINKVRKNKDIPAFAAIELDRTCPRKILGYVSGEGMQWCPAQHAENNAIIDAARKGASTIGTTLYMNCIIPCKNCYGALINAGIVEIVVDDVTVYDKHTQYLIDNSNIKIRRFEL